MKHVAPLVAIIACLALCSCAKRSKILTFEEYCLAVDVQQIYFLNGTIAIYGDRYPLTDGGIEAAMLSLKKRCAEFHEAGDGRDVTLFAILNFGCERSSDRSVELYKCSASQNKSGGVDFDETACRDGLKRVQAVYKKLSDEFQKKA